MAIQDEIPKSRLTLRYRTEINGQPEDITLPLRMLVTGDLSQGTSKDRQTDLDERRLRNLDGKNTDAVMKDMGISLKFTVPNKVDPDKDEDLQVEIPIDSMKSFSPEQVAKHVPKLKGLLMLKSLLEEVMSSVDNRKEFRKLLGDLMSDEAALAKMLEELKGYEEYRLPASGQKGTA
ncbi:MAG: type VI secretion system contractile sheath small subunit [Syntrophobacteraceae bacterium]|jgi:type VI secretion system protein ImpB|nr:type VI secretion system contractile sheath small subunit [Syntrophobacteraceae bacterium]